MSEYTRGQKINFISPRTQQALHGRVRSWDTDTVTIDTGEHEGLQPRYYTVDHQDVIIGAPMPLKTIHMAKFISGSGGVSALCFRTPHAINLAKATWTNRPEAVSCPTCNKRLAVQTSAATAPRRDA